MILVWVALIGLAAYRLFRLFAVDLITEPLRDHLPDSEWLRDLWYCPWCAGSWWAFGVTWATDAVIGFQAPVLVALAAAVVVGWLGERL